MPIAESLKSSNHVHSKKLQASPGKWGLASAAVALALMGLASCANLDSSPVSTHEEPEDFLEIAASVPGIPNTYDRNFLISDELYTQQGLSGDTVQAFFENAPYFGGMRSWLADAKVNGVRAADALVAAAVAENINPMMLVVRMQGERSAIAKRTSPNQHSVDYMMGCGCPDNKPCMPRFKGFDKQMACAAEVMRKQFDRSVDGSGQWRKGKSRKSLDNISVVPGNHATASTYAYTPWVHEKIGGSWLFWNISKKYGNAFAAMGPVSPTPNPTPGEPTPGDDRPWIGSICEMESQCDMAYGGISAGECMSWFDEDANTLAGMCSSNCSGTCNDVAGQAPTFCVEILDRGQCVPQPASQNQNCTAIGGTGAYAMERHIGGASSRVWKSACVPEHAATACSKNGKSGFCVDTSNSTTTCGGGATLETGACPGPGTIQCCAK